jgi:hypothetical protein
MQFVYCFTVTPRDIGRNYVGIDGLGLTIIAFQCLLSAYVLKVLRVKSTANSPAARHGGAWGERRYSSYLFLTSALGGSEWSALRPPAALCLGERTPGTHCTGGWVGPRAGLDTEVRGKILCPCRGSNPGRPVVQSVVRHYTDWATLSSLHKYIL